MLAVVQNFLRKPRVWQLAWLVYAVVLFTATHLPPKTPGVPAVGSDKLAHLAAFAVLALLTAIAWERTAGRLPVRHLFYAWTMLLLIAAVDEWTQSFVGRQTSLADWLADATGAALGLALFAWIRRRRVS